MYCGASSPSDGVAKKHSGHADAVVEYWAGNPAIEIAHGHLYIGPEEKAPREGVQGGPRCTSFLDGCVVLAGSVPCYMTAPEFCEFLGAFTECSHRDFLHCRVLHGHNPEEYLIALWLTSPEVMEALLHNYDDRQYNALDVERCKLYRISGCTRSRIAGEEPTTPGGGKMWRRLVSSAIASDFEPQVTAGRAASKQVTEVVPAGTASATASAVGTASPLMLGASSSSCCSPVKSPLPSSQAINVPKAELLPGPSLEAVPCSIEELFTENLAEGPLAASGPNDKARCAVCLEFIESDPRYYNLTEMDGGVPLTILCGHTFHARCLYRWCDTSCPVCRFQQQPTRTSCCDVCGQHEGLLICLVCGSIGCMSTDGSTHATQHYEATGHTYALEVMTQRVWDYAGNGYVYRLLCNSEDGKMVEHSMPDDGFLNLSLSAGIGDKTTSAIAGDDVAAMGSSAAASVSFAELSAAELAVADVGGERTKGKHACPALTEDGEADLGEVNLAGETWCGAAEGIGEGSAYAGIANPGSNVSAHANSALVAAATDVVATVYSGVSGGAAAAATSAVVGGGINDMAGVADSGTDPGCLLRAAGQVSNGARRAKFVKKHGVPSPESIVAEFNELLSSQLSAQRSYYEEKQHEIEAEFGKELKAAESKRREKELLTDAARRELRIISEDAAAFELETLQVQEAEERIRRQAQHLEGLFNQVSAEQKQFEEKAEDVREQVRLLRQQRAEEVEDLQQQIRDLERFLQMQKKCKTSADPVDLQGSLVVVTEREGGPGSRGGGRGGKRRR